jgi:hypothetical protein
MQWSAGCFSRNLPLRQNVDGKRCNMASFRDTLRQARDALHELRRRLAVAGHTDRMQEIDSLVALAEIEAERKLSRIEEDKQEPKSPGP